MLFAIITFLTAILMEGIGSYMSVVGWNSILIGDWVVIALFVVLDLAKIVSVSFLYQTWKDIKKTWRAYLVFAVIFLMVLTSAGSFGYLSSSFQQAISPNKENVLQLQSAQTQRDQLIAEKKQLTDSKIKIEDQIAKLPTDSVAGRARLIANFKDETKNINSRISKIDSKLDELNKTVLTASTEQIKKDVHIGPIAYFANAFNIPIEKVVSYAILSVIFVFDPLAISLILAGNFLIARRKEKNNNLTFSSSLKEKLGSLSKDNKEKSVNDKELRKEIEEEILGDVKLVLDEELKALHNQESSEKKT